jgi:hypothetical protein
MTTLALPADGSPVHLCAHCAADEMGCAVKRGLGGRECCEKCTHHQGETR